jgi:hypothetical protein
MKHIPLYIWLEIIPQTNRTGDDCPILCATKLVENYQVYTSLQRLTTRRGYQQTEVLALKNYMAFLEYLYENDLEPGQYALVTKPGLRYQYMFTSFRTYTYLKLNQGLHIPAKVEKL